ncbi:MAG: DUF58 domain-containing protein [Deltaproteobacteria bacterium]|nr:DUF58 domain-containing protein [Deltaproteobacteria bacterium]
MNDRPLIDPQVLERLGSLELRARYLVEGTLSGMHASRLSGDNVEFAGHREYVPGEDPKRIDWKAFGRLDRYYIKESLDETNLAVHLAVDCSGSMEYPETGTTKGAYASLLAASLACMALEQGDAAGLYLFPARRVHLPPRASRVYLREIARALETGPREGRASIGAAASELAGMAGRRGLIVLFSDMIDEDPAALDSIIQLSRRGHDVCVFHVLDRSEIGFSASGLTLFCDPESEAQVLVEPDAIREAYLREFGAFLERCRRVCIDAGVDYRLAVTDVPPETALREFLEGRQGRRARA